MAGEINQEPFSLSFQISWEKRSSFSHNRYLEEVDKCSKHGSVIEMKAHFESHFKKKGYQIPTSLESQTIEHDGATESFEDYQSDWSFSENTIQSESSCNYSHEQEQCVQEKIQCEYNEESERCVSYDEILVNTDDVIELEEEGGGDHGTLAVPVEFEDLGPPPEMPLEIEIQIVEDSVLVEEARLEQQVTTKQYNAASGSKKSLKNVKHIVHDVSVTKASTKRPHVMPKAALKTTHGSSLSSNSKTNVDAKSQKQLRPKKIVVSQPPPSRGSRCVRWSKTIHNMRGTKSLLVVKL